MRTSQVRGSSLRLAVVYTLVAFPSWAGTIFVPADYVNSEEAIEHALQIMRRDKGFNDGAAKTLLFEIFDVLGPGETVNAARKRLSSK